MSGELKEAIRGFIEYYNYRRYHEGLGMAAGSWIGGALFDLTGVYTWSILSSIIAGFLGVALALVLPPRHQ